MKLTTKEITIFGMLGALMYASKMIMEVMPNVHLLSVFTISFTLVYRKKALYPIYVYVLILGVFSGFASWWIPHLYLWTVLWGVTMLLPKNLPEFLKPVLYMLICSLHGFLYGTLYAPVQAILYGYNFKMTLLWITAGIPWDIIHGISNFFCGILIYPITKILKNVDTYIQK